MTLALRLASTQYSRLYQCTVSLSTSRCIHYERATRALTLCTLRSLNIVESSLLLSVGIVLRKPEVDELNYIW